MQNILKTLTASIAFIFAQTPQLPIGMNVQGMNYYTPAMPFNDVMKTSSQMITFDVSGSNTSWDTGDLGEIPLDSNSYPKFLPVPFEGKELGVRILVNNYYSGDFAFLYNGDGDFSFNMKGHHLQGEVHVISLDGTGGHTWFQILRSDSLNPVTNIRIIPLEFLDKENEMPLFEERFLTGLKPFHALRFMDFTGTNNSTQKEWVNRTLTTSRTQAGSGAIEYLIALANELKADAWVCLPHAATDEYIRKFAELVKEKLDPDLTVYVEYSNEIWNWQFHQAHFAGQNGQDSDRPILNVDDTLKTQLENVGIKYCGNTTDYCHPEKDAHLMARTMRIWESVFADQRSRLVTVAAVQHAWVDNTKRILNYLFKDEGGGIDAVSPAGYFGFQSSDHDIWVAMDSNEVTPQMVMQAAVDGFDSHTKAWTEGTSEFAKEFEVDYLVYEGGQHMQPQNQQEWGYNHAVWDAQISQEMYDLYMTNFTVHQSVDTKLFMAFSYVGSRQSRYGSWGHLEDLDQLSAGNLKSVAPKYQALLDANTPREDVVTINQTQNLDNNLHVQNVQELKTWFAQNSIDSYELLSFDGKVLDTNHAKGLVIIHYLSDNGWELKKCFFRR